MNGKDFAMNIRISTKNLHTATEATGFNNRLVSGKATKESYAEFIYNYIYVYEAIENSLDLLKNDGRIKPFVTKELYRSESLKRDVNFLLGAKSKELEILPSTKAYVSRIQEVSKSNPILLIAHAYTRFLADLFGGRTIHEIVKDKYNIEEKGLNYFQFPEITDIMGYVMEYRKNLSNMDLNNEEQNLFINEVSNSYIYNLGISTELEAKLYGEPMDIPPHGHGMKIPMGHPHIKGEHTKMPVGHPHR